MGEHYIGIRVSDQSSIIDNSADPPASRQSISNPLLDHLRGVLRDCNHHPHPHIEGPVHLYRGDRSNIGNPLELRLWFQWAIEQYLEEKVMDDEQSVIAEVWWAGQFNIQSFYGMTAKPMRPMK